MDGAQELRERHSHQVHSLQRGAVKQPDRRAVGAPPEDGRVERQGGRESRGVQGAKVQLHRDHAALVVDAHEGREEGVEGHPCDDEDAGRAPGAGHVGAREEERDGGEKEAGFLVGDEGEEEGGEERGGEVWGIRGVEKEGDGRPEEEGEVEEEVGVGGVEAVVGEVAGGEIVEKRAEGGGWEAEDGSEGEIGRVEVMVDEEGEKGGEKRRKEEREERKGPVIMVSGVSGWGSGNMGRRTCEESAAPGECLGRE